ncbi:MAG: EamA family transporter [Terriglobales bacterium]
MSDFASPALSLAAAATWGAADFSGGVATKRANPFHVVVVAHATGMVFMLTLALATRESIPGRNALLWGAIAGLVGGIGLAAFYKALAIGTMGINAPLSAVITAIVPLVFSFLTEGLPRAIQIAGFVLALLSIWLIAGPPAGAVRSRGLALAVVAGFGFGGFLLFIKLAGTGSVFWPLVAARSASTLFMLAIMVVSGTGWKTSRGSLAYMVIAGVLDSGANALFVAAAHRGRLDVAAVLSSLYPATTVVLARLVLRERLSRLQFAGMAIAFVAVALIAAR